MLLDDFKNSQSIAYNIMINELKNNHISHAYLIDENNNSEAFSIVMAFVKAIICMDKTYDDGQAICKRIDEGNYPEIKIIEPDGLLIKKQQILDLQKDFSKTAFEGNKRIYIIKDAEKMRSETANSMLKFLEEPENDLVAILMTNNYNNLLSTIVSRCQIIRLNNFNSIVYDNDLFSLTLNFVKTVENSGIISIASEQELLFNYINIKDKDKISEFFEILIDIYYDILKIIIGNYDIKYKDYFDEIKMLVGNNNYSQVLEKIRFLIKYKDSIKCNVNVNLLVDSMIVSVGGVK